MSQSALLMSGLRLKCYSGFLCIELRSTFLAKIWKGLYSVALLSSDVTSLHHHCAPATPASLLWLQCKCFPISRPLHVLFPLLGMLLSTLHLTQASFRNLSSSPSHRFEPFLNILIAPRKSFLSYDYFNN